MSENSLKVNVSVTDTELFEDVVGIMKEMYDVLDEDSQAFIGVKLDRLNEKYKGKISL